MSETIRVENLWKQYRIGQTQTDTMFRELLMNIIRNPFRGNTDKRETIWALRDISFSVSEGEILGIIGRNGAGKSTLLKILSRITFPTSGNFRVIGKVASLLEVGTGFHEELTGRENIFMSGSILGMSRKRMNEKMDSIVEFSGVDQFIDTPIKRYSSGMRVRLGFSVAAHLESDILLVDEVLAVGDGEFQKKCLNAMGNLRSAGRTVLFVSHNLAAIENLCTRALWVENGKISLDGNPKDVIRAYMGSFETQRSGYDLVSIKSRRGSGDIRFVRIEFLDREGNPDALVRSGDSFIARLHFRVSKQTLSPIFGMEIQNQNGVVLSQIHTYNSDYEIPSLRPGEGYIDVMIRDLNLTPGRYYISLFVANLGYLFHDVLNHCAFLDVEESTRYGSGKGRESNPSLICLDCEWKLGGTLSDSLR